MNSAAERQVTGGGKPMPPLEVRTGDELAAAAGLQSLRHFMSAKRLLLRVPWAPSSMQEATERRLNVWLGVCGCKPGALSFLATLAWQIAGPSRAHGLSAEVVLFGGGLAVAAGILGKVTVLLLARSLFVVEISLFRWRIRRYPREGKRVI